MKKVYEMVDGIPLWRHLRSDSVEEQMALGGQDYGKFAEFLGKKKINYLIKKGEILKVIFPGIKVVSINKIISKRKTRYGAETGDLSYDISYKNGDDFGKKVVIFEIKYGISHIRQYQLRRYCDMIDKPAEYFSKADEVKVIYVFFNKIDTIEHFASYQFCELDKELVDKILQSEEQREIKKGQDIYYKKGDRMKKFRDFYELSEELIKQGKKFDENSLGSLTFKDLQLACIGNAGESACSYDLVRAEQNKRIKEIAGHSSEEIENDKGKWEILDDNHMYWEYYRSKSANIDRQLAPKWRLLVESMTNLRGDWSDGRESKHLTKIYSLLPEVEKEGIVPIKWCKAVKMNADKFDGIFNDGRIMRDGRLVLHEDVADILGFPTTDASGNIAKMFGAVPEKNGGFRGSYTELFEEILTPEQKIVYLSKLI